MMASSPTSLLDLPSDIIHIIVDLLKPLGLLFVPIFDAGRHHNRWKYIEPHPFGRQTESDLQCSQGLMKWSSTCHHFRELIAPELFRCVILRNKPTSLESVKTLSRSPHWAHVRSLIFVACRVDYPPQECEDTCPEYREVDTAQLMTFFEGATSAKKEAELQDVAEILSNLPPNLTSLAIDFPQVLPHRYGLHDFIKNHYFDQGEGFARAESTDQYRALLRTVLEAASRSQYASGPEFELILHRIPPLRCSALEQLHWHRMLNRVTSFTLSLAFWGIYRLMTSETPAASKFASNLGEFFLNHLTEARKLKIHSNIGWPLGHDPVGGSRVLLPLPITCDHLSRLEHVSFKQIFLSNELVKFLIVRAQVLVSIELDGCYAQSSQGSANPVWADFFNALVAKKPNRLLDFRVNGPRHGTAEMAMSDDKIEIDKKFNQAEANCKEKLRQLGKQLPRRGKVEDLWQRRRLLSYYEVRPYNGRMTLCKEESWNRFLSGEDNIALFELFEIVEQNREGEELAKRG